MAKVVKAHADAHPELREVEAIFGAVAADWQGHMLIEEAILFQASRDLEARGSSDITSLQEAVRAMEADHVISGARLERLRALIVSYKPPPAACNSYIAMLDGLEALERDLHQHIHEENSILFPRALALERARWF